MTIYMYSTLVRPETIETVRGESCVELADFKELDLAAWWWFNHQAKNGFVSQWWPFDGCLEIGTDGKERLLCRVPGSQYPGIDYVFCKHRPEKMKVSSRLWSKPEPKKYKKKPCRYSTAF